MKKVFAASVVAVLLIGSSAMAQIDMQYQNWALGLGNSINLSGGAASASTIQGIGTLTLQNLSAGGPVTASTGIQGIAAALFQDGSATTLGAPIGLTQGLTVAGASLTVNTASGPVVMGPGQQQSVGLLAGPVVQYEGVAVAGNQAIQKLEGPGASADGLNLVAFGMGQEGTNMNADGGQLSVIIGGQFSELDAPDCTTIGTVVTTMNATVQQFQTANN